MITWNIFVISIYNPEKARPLFSPFHHDASWMAMHHTNQQALKAFLSLSAAIPSSTRIQIARPTIITNYVASLLHK